MWRCTSWVVHLPGIVIVAAALLGGCLESNTSELGGHSALLLEGRQVLDGVDEDLPTVHVLQGAAVTIQNSRLAIQSDFKVFGEVTLINTTLEFTDSSRNNVVRVNEGAKLTAVNSAIVAADWLSVRGGQFVWYGGTMDVDRILTEGAAYGHIEGVALDVAGMPDEPSLTGDAAFNIAGGRLVISNGTFPSSVQGSGIHVVEGAAMMVLGHSVELLDTSGNGRVYIGHWSRIAVRHADGGPVVDAATILACPLEPEVDWTAMTDENGVAVLRVVTSHFEGGIPAIHDPHLLQFPEVGLTYPWLAMLDDGMSEVIVP